TQAFEQRLKQELEENPALESGKEPLDEYDDDFGNSNDYDDDNDSINADDINVDEYLSDDDVPDYRTQANNYSSDDEEKTM
ncbi:MAG TPA: RNA polymerase sigma-54 factor, partial [Xanthomarina gelatinilytica]|nr:RNA polymerase sigma-54 factor [Xanthomarina gelatinilytica]